MNKYLLIVLFFLFHSANAEETAWVESELTQKYMRTLNKQQCIEKTISSLQLNNPSEEYIKNLAGITGDCVTWAQGTEKELCKSYSEKNIKKICSVNLLSARDCVLIHVMYQSSCFTPKY